MTEKEKKIEQDFKKEVELDIKANNHKWEKLAAFVIIFIFGLMAVGGLVWFVDNANTSDDYVSNVTVKKTTVTKSEQSDWKTYTNDLFNFSLKYPSTWTLTDKLQTDIATKGTAASSLILNNNEKYSMVLWVNPDGFGSEGQSEYVNYENTKVSGSKIILGTRKYTKLTEAEQSIMGGTTPATGFRISTSFSFNGDDYVISMSGKNASDLVAAETEVKDIIATYKWTN